MQHIPASTGASHVVGDGAEEDPELTALKASLLGHDTGRGTTGTTSHIAALVALTKTVDQVCGLGGIGMVDCM